MKPAIALFEYTSVAEGIAAGDAMVKRAPLEGIYAGTVQPGRYLIIVGGSVAAVEEAWLEAHEGASVRPEEAVFLPNLEPRILAHLCGDDRGAEDPDADDSDADDADADDADTGTVEALGILETRRAPAALEAADAGLKGAEVALLDIRLSDGLGGKAYVLFSGAQSSVEAAIEIAAARVGQDALVATSVIPQFHPEMLANLRGEARFMRRLRSHKP
jgi:microcompartment protein CcmL/EutN